MSLRSISSILALLLACVGLSAAPALAAEPPNQNDPCSRAGKNTCGTNGVGRHETYRYGIRWFGDYRGAVKGESDPTFCIDLRFWYPAQRFAYKQREAKNLRNKDGKRVAATRLRYMNYALWKYGRSKEVTRQAATMLYVHHLMGDGAPGEVDPAAVGSAVDRTFEQISSEAKKFAGPYRVKIDLPATMVAGTPSELTLQVISAAGYVVPDVSVRIDAKGAAGLARDARTGPGGTLKVEFTPDDAAGDLQVTATAQGLAAESPKLFVPTRGQSARNAQRLVSAASTARSQTAVAAVEPAQVQVTTAATPQALGVGGESRDKVTITGAPSGWTQTVQVALFGPFASRQEIVCSGTPAHTTSYVAGPGESLTPPLTLAAPGWYGYQLTVPSTPNVTGLTTPCVPDEETVHVQQQPAIRTQISEQSSLPGAVVTDDVFITGLGGATVTVEAELWGPYPSRAAMTCTGAPHWKGSFTATGDGTYTTAPVTLTVPGYYTYREAILETATVRGVQAPCGEVSETTVVRGTPAITTQISSAATAPGAELRDTAVVSGLGALQAPVEAELWGPYPTRESMTCTGTPFWKGSFTANGDGSYLTDPVVVTTAGYYTYRERILATEAFAGVETACGEATETTLTKAAPKVVTEVADQVVAPGSSVADRLTVTGLGTTPATIEVELFGPFATRAAISCGGAPYWSGKLEVPGDGTFETEPARVRRAGFYTYRERIAGTGLIDAHQAECGEASETALAAPLIQTGRILPPRARRAELREDARAASGPRPTRVQLDRLGIDAPVDSVGIDTRRGELNVPANVRRTAWWRDGAAPGRPGSTLIAGHVDSAKQGAGAFYRVKDARRGDRITVTTVDGKRRTYRVTKLSAMRKNRLPQSIFGREGDQRLYLVTCGGPFNLRTGHYRDNVVLTAVPV